eukprot:2792907-Rhodomonas_salina.1
MAPGLSPSSSLLLFPTPLTLSGQRAGARLARARRVLQGVWGAWRGVAQWTAGLCAAHTALRLRHLHAAARRFSLTAALKAWAAAAAAANHVRPLSRARSLRCARWYFCVEAEAVHVLEARRKEAMLTDVLDAWGQAARDLAVSSAAK